MTTAYKTSSHNTQARWKSRSNDGYILISQMDDGYLMNCIKYCLNKKGHKHSKLDKLVTEAKKRGLPLPNHKFIQPYPKNSGIPDNQKYADMLRKTEFSMSGTCPRCFGTKVYIGHDKEQCLNCGTEYKTED